MSLQDKDFYDSVGLLKEAQRYKTSREFLDAVYSTFNNIDKLLSIGVGSRLLTISASLPKEFYGLDANPGSIERARQFIKHWEDYQTIAPFSTEFSFLKSKSIAPKFDNCNLYVGKIPNKLSREIPKGLSGILASELVLHLTDREVIGLLETGKAYLHSRGKMLITAYVSGNSKSLDEQFIELASKVKMSKEEFIKKGVINIKKLANELKRIGNYSAYAEKFWLDLNQIRVFDEREIEKQMNSAGLKITGKEDIRCGMFPFAYRLVYT